jgi:hypothetical protein
MFNAPSHRYCWTLPAAGRRRDQGPPRDWPSLYSAAFITTKGVVLYYASDPAALLVQECKGEALNLDDAGRRALDEIKAHLDDTRFGKQSHRVGLGLPREFSSPPGFSMYYLTVLRNVVHDGDKWRLTLKNRWTVEVLLDADYHLIETKRVEALLPYH